MTVNNSDRKFEGRVNSSKNFMDKFAELKGDRALMEKMETRLASPSGQFNPRPFESGLSTKSGLKNSISEFFDIPLSSSINNFQNLDIDFKKNFDKSDKKLENSC